MPEDSLNLRVLDRAMVIGLAKAKGFCTSQQLRKYMFAATDHIGPRVVKGVLRSPAYWSIYHHIGRANMSVIHPSGASFLAWFKNPKEDPRLINGESPIYRSQVKSLRDVMSKDEFRAAVDARKIIFSKTSPRDGSAKFKGNPFFSNDPSGGMAGFNEEVGQVAREEASKAVGAMLQRTGLKKKTVIRTI